MKYENKFTPSLLDAFQQYLDSEQLYEKFYGRTEEPSLTYQEYEEKQFKELIDKINRVPFESEAADKGSCLNEVIDCIVLGVKSTREDIEISSKTHYLKRDVSGLVDPADGKVIGGDVDEYLIPCPHIEAKKGDNVFMFDIPFCKRIGEYFKDSLCQIYVEAPIETKYGTVLLYGYPDYVRGDMVYDLKTTSKYEFGKYSKYWQQHVYPYALIESGQCTNISAFEFSAFLMKGGTSKNPLIYGDFYPEVYTYSHQRSKEALRGICERFHEFLINNQSLIQDEKIFGGDKKANS